ncbi:MAG TPA: DUF3179 domain-containing (seleno)protein, partial [Thermoanaerobaculia bacterium]|nr:DUF3179 domain-containing (seleno)protein [Thermoanaerobaculia bacterium]
APLDLKVMMQLENNLVLFDTATGEPIEQIYCRGLDRGPLAALPTTIMPLSSFRALYPQGRIFWNPPAGLLDRQVRGILNRLLFAKGGHFDPTNPKPAFPTIAHTDPRVPPKEPVYGIALGEEAIAFTQGYLQSHGGAVTETLGGKTFTVKHFPTYGFVDVFEGAVPDVDPYGLAGGTQVPRLPHANQVLWIIWANFYRGTAVRA